MKRFLIFASNDFYPRGGWLDLAGEADTQEDAVRVAEEVVEGNPEHISGMSWHVVDTESREIVAKGESARSKSYLDEFDHSVCKYTMAYKEGNIQPACLWWDKEGQPCETEEESKW